MTVEITGFAEESLRQIHCRYPKEKADSLSNKILDRTETLSTLASRGRIVEELRDLQQGHRFILESHYKIIYYQQGENVYVTDIFDMHQEPSKIRERHLS